MMFNREVACTNFKIKGKGDNKVFFCKSSLLGITKKKFKYEHCLGIIGDGLSGTEALAYRIQCLGVKVQNSC